MKTKTNIYKGKINHNDKLKKNQEKSIAESDSGSEERVEKGAGKDKIVVTAALPYANGQIHIGHLLEYIQADIYSRFLKLIGKDALYICASDTHGTPIEINAKKAGKKPEQFVKEFWKEHKKDFADYLIRFDNFHSTHSDENKELARFFFKKLKDAGHIYIKKIKIIYCNTCQRSLPDRFVKGTCPHCNAEDQYGDVCEKCSSVIKGADLINPYCVTCKSKPIKKDSKHYFFKLSKFESKLFKWIIESDIQPEIRNWLDEWLRKGLDDWCISRDAPYFGFEIPGSEKETGEKKYFYVWLDAPIGYISSTKNYCEKHNAKIDADKKSKEVKLNWKDYWYKSKVHHIIGKDIAYFHYLFWPAMLLDVGIPLPSLTTHGFITVNGQKMSKSRGTFFTAKDFLALYPAEALRFYYASHLDNKVVDIDLSLDEFIAVNNNVLTGNVGNFCYRVLTFAEKNYGTIDKIAVEGALQKKIEELIGGVHSDYQNLNFKSAVKKILKIADLGNAYFQEKEPWKDKEKKESYVGFCVNLSRNLAIVLSPILPEFSKKVFKALKVRKVDWSDCNFEWKGKVEKVEVLVQKIEKKEVELFPLRMRVGQIKEVNDHPNADSLYLLKVDFGDEERQVVAGLKKERKKEELLGLKCVFCVNLKKAKLRGELSEAMILVADDKKNIGFLESEKKLGEFVEFGGLESSFKEITFDDFKKLKMVVNGSKVIYDGKILLEVKVGGVKDGARIY